MRDSCPRLSRQILNKHSSDEVQEIKRRVVDGVHFNVRLKGDCQKKANRQCVLVIIPATAEGKKELVAVYEGAGDSEQSWMELMLDLKSRGLVQGRRVPPEGSRGIADVL